MAKRLKVYAEKKAKLANSHFFVSKTRLCVRNLPTHVDEKKLKAVFQNSMGNPTAKVLQVCLDVVLHTPHGGYLLCVVLGEIVAIY